VMNVVFFLLRVGGGQVYRAEVLLVSGEHSRLAVGDACALKIELPDDDISFEQIPAQQQLNSLKFGVLREVCPAALSSL